MNEGIFTTITEANAYRYNDNFSIQSKASGGIHFLGTEHNKQEAEAIAAWASDYHGHQYIAVRNSLETVRKAKAIRPNPVRFQRREEALKEMGVW